MSVLKNNFKASVSWNLIGTVFSQVALFATNIVIAQIIGRDGFGHFGIIQSTIMTLSGMAQLAMSYTSTKYLAEYRTTDIEKAGRVLALCSIISIVMGLIATLLYIIGSPYLIYKLIRAPELSIAVLLGALSLLFSVLNGYQLGALAGLDKYKSIAKLSSIYAFLNLVFVAFGAFYLQLNGAVIGFSFGYFIKWVIFRVSLLNACNHHGIEFNFRDMFREKEVIIYFAVPAALSGLIAAPVYWLGNMILVSSANGFSELAVFNAANSLKTGIIFIPQIINSVTMSLINHQKGVDLNGYRNLYWTNFKITITTVLLVSILVGASGGLLLNLFGKDFISGHLLVIILASSAVPEAIALAIYQIVQSQGKMWQSLTLVVFPRDITYLTFCYILIPLYGSVGMGAAVLISQVVNLICVALVVRRIRIRL